MVNFSFIFLIFETFFFNFILWQRLEFIIGFVQNNSNTQNQRNYL
jgi:hypothetical protein